MFGGITLVGPLLGDNDDARDSLDAVLIGGAITLAALVVLPAVLYPESRALLRWRPLRRPHPALAVSAGIGMVGLLGWVATTLTWHASGGVVENPVEDDWMGPLFLAGGLVVALALVVAQRPGWRWLAGATVAATVYTGVASIALPDAPTGWGPVGGGVGIVLGLALGAAAVAQAGHVGAVVPG